MHGLDWYDYEARNYESVLSRFTTMDPLAEKYYSISPYAYCAGNPVNAIDINGDSITVLNLGQGTEQHLGMLIQNDIGKWQYFSINGDNAASSGRHTGGREFDDIGVGEWSSPQEFLQSEYNQVGLKDDKSVNNYNYQEAFVIGTTKEQDDVIRDRFINISQSEEYSLSLIKPNHCGTAVQKSLNAVGIETKDHRIFSVKNIVNGNIYKINISRNPYLPSNAFKSIINNNPNGILINRKK